MPQFAIIAKDAPGALEARKATRPSHVEHTRANQPAIVLGGATLTAAGDMDGSLMIVDFPTQEALQAWLDTEPYVLNNIWQDIQIVPLSVGLPFYHLFPSLKTDA